MRLLRSLTVLFMVISALVGCVMGDDDKVATTAWLSGTITPAQFSAVDNDINDPFAPYSTNNKAEFAQILSNPVVLGGYVNLPGKGPVQTTESGRIIVGSLHEKGDQIDVYKVNLLAGQTIKLNIAEDRRYNDLRLLLVDQNLNTINTATSNGQSDSLTVSEQDIAGEYFVAVMICGGSSIDCGRLDPKYRGYSNYTLSVGQPELLTTAAGVPSGSDLNSDFVPGDILVRFKPRPAFGKAFATDALVMAAGELGLSVKGGSFDRLSLLNLGDTTNKQKAALAALGFNDPGMSAVARSSDPQRQLKLQTLMAIQALRRRPEIQTATVNLIRRPLFQPNDTYYRRQWSLPLINVPQAWDINTGNTPGGKPVVVAVIDTGVLLDHPDLQGQFSMRNQSIDGYDFIRNVDSAGDGDGIDSNPDDPGDRPDPSNCEAGLSCLPSMPSTFHGTHVAGIVAATGNNGLGVAGVAYNARIMPIRAVGRHGGTSYDVIQGMRYAAGLSNDSGRVPVQKADIINLSLGGPDDSQVERVAVQEVRAQGVIIVAASGNESTALPVYPAAYNGVISVSAVGGDKRLAPYSNFGTSIDIAAPGGNSSQDLNSDGILDGIFSTVGDDKNGAEISFTYAFYQGTSMAAPHVSGILALMKAVNPDLTPEIIDLLIANGHITHDIGSVGRDHNYGYGLIDALKAVTAADSALNLAGPILVASQYLLNFGASLDSVNLNLSNAGKGAIVIDVPVSSHSWLTVEPFNTNDNGEGDYRVKVNRDGLAFGPYNATIDISSNSNSLSLTVFMLHVDPSAAKNVSAGYLYARLLDPITGETLIQVNPSLSNGKYRYSFSGIVPGQYLLVAGNDSDNDLAICQLAESCGAYSSRAQPTLLNLAAGENRTRVDFSVNFDQGVLAQSLQNMLRSASHLEVSTGFAGKH